MINLAETSTMGEAFPFGGKIDLHRTASSRRRQVHAFPPSSRPVTFVAITQMKGTKSKGEKRGCAKYKRDCVINARGRLCRSMIKRMQNIAGVSPRMTLLLYSAFDLNVTTVSFRNKFAICTEQPVADSALAFASRLM